MPQDIVIKLSVDAQKAAESVAQLAQAASQAIEQTYVRAVEKAEQKLDDLNRKQNAHRVVIEENGKVVADLSNKRTAASEAEQKNIDAEISKLKQLTAARELDIAKLEQQKAKQKEKAVAASEATDQEKLAMKFATDNHVIELQMLQDSIKAKNAVRDTSTADTQKRLADMDAMTRRQQVFNDAIKLEQKEIQNLETSQAGASEVQRESTQKQIDSLQKSIAGHQTEINLIEAKKIKAQEAHELMAAHTDQHKQAIQTASAEQMAQLQALMAITKSKAAAETSADNSAIAGIEKVISQRKVYADVIDADKAKLAELEAKEQQADVADKKAAEQQVVAMKRVIAARQEDLLELDIKRIKLEELLALENAQSEKEEADIRKTTQARLAEVEALMDVNKAENAVKDTTEESSLNMSKFISAAGGLIGVVSMTSAVVTAFRTIGDVLQADIDKLNDLNKAMTDMQNRQMSAQQRLDAGFNEYGATDEDTKRKIQGVLLGDATHDSIPVQYGSNEDQTRTAFAAIAPILKQNNITPDDPRFASLVGTASLFVKKGMDDTLIRNTTADVLNGNKAASGDDLNQHLSQLVDVAGSPKFASPLGDAIYQHHRQAELGGLSDTDLMKMWQAGRSKGLSPEETGDAVGQLEQSSRRFVGKSYDERVELFEKLSGVLDRPGAKERIEALKRYQPQKVLDAEMGMTPNVSPTVRKWLEKSATTRDVLSDMSGMSVDDLNNISTHVGGGRLSPNAAAVLPGWTNQQLPAASMTQPLITPEQHIQALSDQGDNRAAMSQSLSVTGEAFGNTLPNTVGYMSQHRDLYPSGMDPQGFGQSYVPGINTLMGDGNRKLTPEMIQRSYAIGREYLSAARMLDDPRLPKEAKDQIRQQMKNLLPYLGIRAQGWTDEDGKKHSDMTQDLSTLMGDDSSARAKMLKDLGTQDQQMNFLKPYSSGRAPELPGDILNNQTLGGTLDQIDAERAKYIDKVPTQGPPAPAHPTSQTSAINYHVRNTIYGYTADSLGSMNRTDNYG